MNKKQKSITRNGSVKSIVASGAEICSKYAYIVEKYAEDDPDLRQVGFVGLLVALQRYDKNKGPFSSWAPWYVKNHIEEAKRRRSFICLPEYVHEILRDPDPEPRHFDLIWRAKYTYAQPLCEVDPYHGGLDDVIVTQLGLRAGLGSLKRKERKLIYLHYTKGLTIAECARQLGLPSTTIRTMRENILIKLRSYLEA
jgi:RNA polymerase sigma factor (sigma-70 family)